jgi:hypothetical protein
VNAPACGVDGLGDYIEHFRARVVQDAITDALASQWQRRARTFERCLPRPDDFTGRATPQQLEEQRERIAATILACRQRATVSLIGGQL